jgi:hypothetical protein
MKCNAIYCNEKDNRRVRELSKKEIVGAVIFLDINERFYRQVFELFTQRFLCSTIVVSFLSVCVSFFVYH